MDYMNQQAGMQDRALQTNMEQMQQMEPEQVSVAMEMCPYENARAAVPAQLPELVDAAVQHRGETYMIAREHLEFLRGGLAETPDQVEEEFHWLRNITGGGSATFSSKRGADGRLRTDMKLAEYDTLEYLTGCFYDVAGELTDIAPRERELALFRGIRIPKISVGASETAEADIAAIMSQYGDVIPSSASWDMETPLHFADAEAGQDAVIFHMLVPPDFPLVMLSYPEEIKEGDPIPLCIPGQQEVLVGASTFSDVRLLLTEEREGYRCYHVEVKLNAVPRGAVIDAISDARKERNRRMAQKQPEQTSVPKRRACTRDVVERVFGKTIDEMKVGQRYQSIEQPDVWYELKRIAFASTFELVEE